MGPPGVLVSGALCSRILRIERIGSVYIYISFLLKWVEHVSKFVTCSVVKMDYMRVLK